jgi:ABC-2 type transport system permease protein
VKAKAIRAQTRIEMLLTVRRGESLLVTLVIPLGILVFFSSVDAVNTTYKDPVDFLVPGVLALAVMSSAMVSLGIATGYERRYGVLKRLGSTPLSRAGLLSAKTLNVLVLEIVQAIVIVVTGIALGWNATGGLVAAVVLLLVGTIAFAGIGMLLAGTLRAEANLAVANGLFLVLLFLGGSWYPITGDGFITHLAKELPSYWVVQASRAGLGAPHPWGSHGFAVITVWTVALVALAAQAYQRDTRRV